ncbi:MAG: 3'-5' exonuclease [Gammaproteobacteria bacterium]|nr:MAG: 3'-5' exonuclease [Gammaproteobacteria bacterium]
MISNILAFDIETAPDVDSGRRLYGLDDLNDADVAQAMFEKRRQETGNSDFLRHHLHRVIAISAVLRRGDTLRVWSLGDEGSGEADLIQRFFDGIDKFLPTIVSWNGAQFDLPVLHYRALVHGVSAPRYWDIGDDDREFRWNNYLNRFHWRHIDLMDILSGYQPRATASLNDIAIVLGLPGKLGMNGAQVWEQYLAGQIEAIRNYCETDVLNTYLIYLRWELIRGHLDRAGWESEQRLVRDTLGASGKPHLQEFLKEWGQGGS